VRTGSGRRRLRLRRKRKDESFASPFSTVRQPAKAERDSSSAVADIAAEVGEEVVFRMGCCLVEAIGGAVVLAAFLTVPAYLLIR
jgi:hypothetical protein